MAEDNLYAPPQADIEVDEPAELAGRVARFGGALLDSVIAMLFVFPVMSLTGYWDRAFAEQQNLSDTILVTVVAIVIFIALNGYLLAMRGQSIGKMIVKTRIVSIADNKILPLWRIFSLRYLPVWIITAIPLLGPIFGLVDSLFVFRADRRCVHDLIAGTKVITATSAN